MRGCWLRLAVTLAAAGCAGNDDDIPPATALAGGATTIFDETSQAFSTPAPNLSAGRLRLHLAGDAAFEATFVSAPAPVNPGLGPLFNMSSCRGCHVNDGRGRPPSPGEPLGPLLFRLSVVGADADGGPAPVPGFGTQLQTRATAGFMPEGDVRIAYHDSAGRYGDGSAFVLQVPDYIVTNAWTGLPAGLMLSPRVAPPVFGLGLLEAVTDATIEAMADPADADHDGISGRPNRAWDPVRRRVQLGRFGLKASVPSLRVQVLRAYLDDIGVTSTVFPHETCTAVAECPDDGPDLQDAVADQAVFYVQSLAVPARRRVNDPDVRRGEQLFGSAGCTGCHRPSLHTGVHPDVAEVSSQAIQPWTDLLLHDMGPALADGRPDFEATGQEWRTAPLWGIGLTRVVNGHTRFLHDGRAQGLAEAVLWHGGEAKAARERFRTMTPADRAAVLAFLESL